MLTKCPERCFTLQNLFQVHGTEIVPITEQHLQNAAYQRYEGDVLMTDQCSVPLSVMTADCLPLLLYDKVQHACALLHVGWRGLVQDIIEKTVITMEQAYHTHPSQLHAFLGPAARSCCYEVTSDWVQNCLPARDHHAIRSQESKLFFDLATAAIARLVQQGIIQHQIDATQSVCTICSTEYWSHRHNKEHAQRNLTVVMLHSNQKPHALSQHKA